MEAFNSKNFEETLFNGDVQVRRLENGAAFSAASAHCLKLLVQLRSTTSASKELLVRLTDEDPVTLYTCVVCNDDYLSLRQSQGLLINFDAFPYKFVELVETCIRENETSSPRFVLVLQCSEDIAGSSTLEVVEINNIKVLSHLSLKLTPASTQHKLTYLADCCKTLKAEITLKEREAAEKELQLKQQIQHMQDIIAKTSNETQKLQAKLDQQNAVNNEKHNQLLNQEKHKLLKLQSDADRKADRERRDLEARMNHQIDQLNAKITSLTHHNSEISERRHRAESNVKELRSKLSNVEGALERCRQELSHTKKHNVHLDQDYQSKSKALRELETRAAHLEADLLSKSTILTQTQQMVESLQQQKINLEEALEEKRQKLVKREQSIQLIYAELQKSLDVIKKLQKRLQQEHMTSNVRGAALLEQDKVVDEKDSKVTLLTDQLQEATTMNSQLNLDNNKLQHELREALEKLQEQEKTLKTNENVISWLNKQLNEAEMAGAVVKRAPLTEAYLTSHGVSSQGPSGVPHGLVSHSTPLSNTIQSFPTVTSGWSLGAHTTVSSVRNLGNIPPIPEEISPRNTDASLSHNASPPDKENLEGLEPRFLEATAIPVHGLLRANYRHNSHPESDTKIGCIKDTKTRSRNENQRGKGKSTGKGGVKSIENMKKPSSLSNKKQSSYFPKT